MRSHERMLLDRKKLGFTLLELLTVVVIIGFLVTLTGTAAIKMRKMAVEKKRDVQKSSIESVAASYRHEYGTWPGNVNASIATNQLVNHQELLSYLWSELNGDGSSYDASKNPKNIHFVRASDYEIDDSDNILDPVSQTPFNIWVNLSDDKFWCENGD